MQISICVLDPVTQKHQDLLTDSFFMHFQIHICKFGSGTNRTAVITRFQHPGKFHSRTE